MNKRSLLFVLALTTLFFLMNQWFDYGGGYGGGPSSQKVEVDVISGAGSPTRLSPEEAAKYNAIKLFKNVELTEFFSQAVRVGDNFLLIAPSSSIPEEVYVPSTEEKITSARSLTLRVKPDNEGAPALYSLYPLSKLVIPYVPEVDTYRGDLLSFDGEQIFHVEGTITLPNHILLKQQPRQNALVFFDFNGTLSPFAFYDKGTNGVYYLNGLPGFKEFTLETFPQDKEVQQEFANQKYYVLENDYQQLVFTNLNGALAEINLPFATEENTKSVVREIKFSKILASEQPRTDSFPQNPYYVPEGNGGMKKVSTVNTGGYYPLLRRNIFGGAGEPTTRVDPLFYAFNIAEIDQSPDPSIYEIKRFEKGLIEFELVEGNRRITKTFSLPKDSDTSPYVLDLTVRIEGDARGLALTTGVPEVELISGNFSPTLKYKVNRNDKTKIEQIKAPKESTSFSHIYPNWVCNGNGFFGIIADPLTKTGPGFTVEKVSGQLLPTRLSLIDAQYQRFPAEKYPGYNFTLPINAKQGVTKYRIFAGPFAKSILQTLDRTYDNPITGTNPDYLSCQSYHGFFAFISEPFAKFLFILLNFFHNITGSWGISIILLTIALRIMLFPLNNWSMKSMAKLQVLSPKLTAIQEKYKKDPKRAQLETMQLYKKEGANPFGGCLPMVIQLPFLLGMFDLLKSSFELRGASFIPGWINNLTAPDVLFSWNYPIIFFGNSFHLLPFLLGGIMFLQQRLMSGKSNSSTGAITDKQKQSRSMGNIMTVVFTFMFYNFPSGLNIYWISSTLLGVLQQWWTSKKITTATKQTPVKK
ncbi:MAG: Membrane protein insertase YidC [Chlamydiae bacterium]|nr:Membrane protein insertase YidC [Chlamydiota bacterium]